VSFDGRTGCPPLASRTIRLSAFERQTTNEIRILQPLDYDARARPTELETLSRAGAVARFAFRRFDPPGEPRRSTPPSGACLATRHILLRVDAFEDRTGSRSRYEPRHTGQGATPRVSPKVLRSSTEPTTSSRRTVLRRPAAPSWRATWAEACERLRFRAARRSRARPLLKGVEHRGIPSSREAPNTLCHQPGCVNGWRAAHDLACRTLADRDPRSRRPPRRRRRSRRPGCLDPLRKNGAGEGLPLAAGRPTST
jgi:hypothetical protein